MCPFANDVVAALAPFHPLVIYHFGSSAQARQRADSDIDIAFLPSQPCDPYAVFTAAQHIAARVGRDVDVIDLSRVGDVLRVQVIGTGCRLYTGDELAADQFEMLALSDYARLNRERHEVLVRAGVA